MKTKFENMSEKGFNNQNNTTKSKVTNSNTFRKQK